MSRLKKNLIIINNFLIIPLLFVLFSVVIFSFFNNGVRNPYYGGLILSLLIIVFCFFMFLGITGSSFGSYTILFIILFIIFILNQIKIIYVGEPLYFSDFVFSSNIGDLWSLISSTFFHQIKSYLVFFIVLLILLVFLVFYSRCVKFNLGSIRKRFFCFLVGFVSLFMLFFPFSWSKSVYSSLFFLDTNDYGTYTSIVSAYSFYGVIGGMFYQMLENRIDVPSNYDKTQLDNILQEGGQSYSDSELNTPNIVVILSESFFDVSLLKDNIVFDKDITPNFNRFKNDGYFVDLISPSYGGRTVNVAFELLTGGNISFFSSGYVPFMHMYSDTNDVIPPSIVEELSNNGYFNEVIVADDMYNSKDVFLKLGFNKYTELVLEDDIYKKGYYVSDDYVADVVVNRIKNNTERYFLFVETMQSHMDYLYSKYPQYDIEVVESNLSEEDNQILLSYAQGIYDADKMLLKVYNEIQNISDETIIIFFGDHLPYLKNINGDNLIEKLQYFNTNDELLNLYRLYNTQALILSNFDMNIDISKNLGFDLLLTSIINQMDVDISSYYRWLYTTKDFLPSYNRYVAINGNNSLQYTYELSGKQLEVFQLRNSMMYKFFVE